MGNNLVNRLLKEEFKVKKILTTILSVGLLTGCSSALEQQADETEIEVEETAALIEAEVKVIAESMRLELDSAVESADEVVVTSGEEAIIVRDVLLPLEEEGYDNLYGYIELSDYTKIEEMRQAGNLLLIEEDTEVEVLEINLYQAKVKIDATGIEGYIPAKYLEQVSSY